jgi:hypothetical protein
MFEIDNVPKPTHSIGAFWQEFGRFMVYYAGVEEQFNFVVRHYYNIDFNSANIILGALRLDTAMQHLNRLREAARIPDQDWREIQAFKEHLGHITRLRNDLAHYGVAYSIPAGYVVLGKWAYTEPRRRKHLISADILDTATTDLFKIYQRLAILHLPHERTMRETGYDELLREPWRYKPLGPGSLYPKLPPTRRERRSQRTPSPP